jgi:hypothetical protein
MHFLQTSQIVAPVVFGVGEDVVDVYGATV